MGQRKDARINQRLSQLGRAQPEHYAGGYANRWDSCTRLRNNPAERPRFKRVGSAMERWWRLGRDSAINPLVARQKELREARWVLMEERLKVHASAGIMDPETAPLTREINRLSKLITPCKRPQLRRLADHDTGQRRRQDQQRTIRELLITLSWISRSGQTYQNVSREALAITMEVDQRDVNRAFQQLCQQGIVSPTRRGYASEWPDSDLAWSARTYHFDTLKVDQALSA